MSEQDVIGAAQKFSNRVSAASPRAKFQFTQTWSKVEPAVSAQVDLCVEATRDRLFHESESPASEILMRRMRKIDARFCCFKIEQGESRRTCRCGTRHVAPACANCRAGSRNAAGKKKEQPARGEPAVLR
jgi:hypothetical protein